MTNYITAFLRSNGHIGAENGIKAAEVLKALGREVSEDSKRRLKKEIRNFRLEWDIADGVDTYIVSDTENGYYLPKTDFEAYSFFKTQDSRAKQAYITVTKLRKYLKMQGLLKKGA